MRIAAFDLLSKGMGEENPDFTMVKSMSTLDERCFLI
jgi:hypothetical protein